MPILRLFPSFVACYEFIDKVDGEVIILVSRSCKSVQTLQSDSHFCEDLGQNFDPILQKKQLE